MTLTNSILIIDDHKEWASRLSGRLAEAGYDVRDLTTMKEALEYLKQHEAPTFILADRMLDEPIETRYLERLCEEVPTSKVLVYTTLDELTPEQRYAIQKKGAYRVLDKGKVAQLVADIKVLIQDLNELLELSAELRAASERSKIMAALVGSDVSVTVVDRHFHRWFSNSSEERTGGASRDLSLTASFEQQNGSGTCWGCTVTEVFRSLEPVDGLFLHRYQDGFLRWVRVRATPIFGHTSNSIIATREAVTEVTDSALAGVPLEQRLHYITQSLIRMGFARARVYKAVSDDEFLLVAAAARSDSARSLKSDYFESIRDAVIRTEQCPYMRLAVEQRVGLFVPEWDSVIGVPKFAKSLRLEPPYFDVPIWREDQKLEGWLVVDFVEIEGDLRESVTLQLAKRESLNWLQDGFGREIKKALEAAGGMPGHRDKFEIAQRARLGIAGAKSVEDATREIREAFGKLLPGCRTSVRMCTQGNLSEFESLCSGVRTSGSTTLLSLQDQKSLSASVARTQIAVWISDYDGYAETASERGEPIGYMAEGTKSTAHIPLRFENSVFGTLSIDSPDTILWEEQGYREPILALAKDTALVLRDLALHEELDQAMAVRAAITAYSVTVSADALWHHWAQQHLAQASAMVARARRLVSANPKPDWEDVGVILADVSTVITRVNTARPTEDAPLFCALTEVFAWLLRVYSDRFIIPSFHAAESLPELRIPAFILRNLLMVLLDNALDAMERSGRGTVLSVETILEDGFLYIDVTDDGPGVPASEQTRILREPMNSKIGKGHGLLYARGAALQYGGDLFFIPSVVGAKFRVRLPIIK